MKFKIIIPALLLLNFQPFLSMASAQEPCLSSRQNEPTPSSNLGIPDIIERGFEALKNQGIEAALDIWFPVKESSFIRRILVEISTGYQNVQDWMGSYLNYSLVYLHQVTDTTQVIYLESHHQSGSVFWDFVVSKGEGDWRINNFSMNSDPKEIIPPYILYEKLKTGNPSSNICQNQQ
jgi:hypothetical protein